MSDNARQAIRRFDGVRRRETMAAKIKRLAATAKGAAVMFMIAVTRFMLYRSETLWNVGLGRW